MLDKIIGLGVDKIANGLGGLVDRFITTSDEKNQFKLEMQKVIQAEAESMSRLAIAEYESKKEIIVAELQHGDNFTKRARPSIVYVGLGVIIYNYCLVPTLQSIASVPLVQFNLPEEFWYAWTGVCGVYAWGRSKEKMKS